MTEIIENLTVDFNVPFVHRLRFTQDVFGEDQHVLKALLESSDEQPARVQFWVDQNVADGTPQLVNRIKQFAMRILPRFSELKYSIRARW